MKKDPYSSQPPAPGPFDKHERVKVSLAFYFVSLLVVALIVFILMLVQYLGGYQRSYKLGQVIKNSDVSMTITIPLSEVEKRKDNPFNKDVQTKQKKQVSDALKGMGARSAPPTSIEIVPEGTPDSSQAPSHLTGPAQPSDSPHSAAISSACCLSSGVSRLSISGNRPARYSGRYWNIRLK